jgi:hypothetical protein
MAFGQLHQLIEQSRWDVLLITLQQASATVQAEAKEPHRDDLPLHMACERRAPDAVILELLKAYPEATKWKGRGGNLALHVAVHRNLDTQVIEALIRANPESLDELNAASFIPRSIVGHSEEAFHALRRPAECWHQLMQDEVREQAQATRLKNLHDKVDAALERVKVSDDHVDALMGRLKQVEDRLQNLESLRHEETMTKTIQKLQESLKEGFESTESRLTTVEDDIKAAAAREFMAKAASRAYQGDVVRMQKKSGETAKALRRQVEQLRVALMTGDACSTKSPTLPSALNE